MRRCHGGALLAASADMPDDRGPQHREVPELAHRFARSANADRV